MFGLIYSLISNVIYFYPTIYKYSIYISLLLVWYLLSFANRVHLRAIMYNMALKVNALINKYVLNKKVRYVIKKHVAGQLCLICESLTGFFEGIEGVKSTSGIVNVKDSAVSTEKITVTKQQDKELTSENSETINIFAKPTHNTERYDGPDADKEPTDSDEQDFRIINEDNEDNEKDNSNSNKTDSESDHESDVDTDSDGTDSRSEDIPIEQKAPKKIIIHKKKDSKDKSNTVDIYSSKFKTIKVIKIKRK